MNKFVTLGVILFMFIISVILINATCFKSGIPFLVDLGIIVLFLEFMVMMVGYVFLLLTGKLN